MKELQLRNRQRDRNIKSAAVRAITVALLEDLLGLSDYAVAVHFVSAPAMARLNSQFLQHEGPTDVITFDLSEGYPSPAPGQGVAGEIYICVAVAEQQAAEFKTSWQAEVVRYGVHGVLHLLGYDDLVPKKRQVMKREENRLVKLLAGRFSLDSVGT